MKMIKLPFSSNQVQKQAILSENAFTRIKPCHFIGHTRHVRQQYHLVPNASRKDIPDEIVFNYNESKIKHPAPNHHDDLDADLLAVLEIATDEELTELYQILHDPSLFSPLAKNLQSAEPVAIDYRGRSGVIRLIIERFRFCAADAQSTLRSRWPSYRETLLNIRSKLSVPCPSNLDTPDLESEIFLHLLAEHADSVGATNKTSSEAAALAVATHAYEGDGMAPVEIVPSRPNIISRVLSPLKLGIDEVLPVVSKGMATFAVTRLHVGIARKLGSVLVQKHVQYEAAIQLAVNATSKGLAGSMQAKIGVQAAQKGLTAAASRYAVARSILGLVGPIMWASTLIDLGVMSLGTDYSRIVRFVFQLSQIRLLRTGNWTAPQDSAPPPENKN